MAASVNPKPLSLAHGSVSNLQSVRGARDFYPDEMRLRSWLFSHFRAAAQLHGFEEYDAPMLEHETLYTRKAG